MTKEKASYLAAWAPAKELDVKLRRMGLISSVRVVVHRNKTYTVTVSLVVDEPDENPNATITLEKPDEDADPAGYTMQMVIERHALPDPKAVDENWRHMAKQCSKYATLRSFQKVW